MKTKIILTLGFLSLFSSFQLQGQEGPCCCPDCLPPLSPQGTIGPQGPQGILGLQGPIGPQGLMGAQGLTGAQGPCCSRTSLLNAFSITDQILPSLATCLFEHVNVFTATSFDVSMLSTTGEITFLKSGTYLLSWTAEGELLPPFPNPVPGWSLTLLLDDIPIPGGCFSGFTLFPAKLTTNTGGTVVISVTAGQVLKLINSSTLPLKLMGSSPGSILPETCVSIIIQSQD